MAKALLILTQLEFHPTKQNS